jgi:hypothetical protein
MKTGLFLSPIKWPDVIKMAVIYPCTFGHEPCPRHLFSMCQAETLFDKYEYECGHP